MNMEAPPAPCFMTEYNLLSDKLVSGKEAVDMMGEFFEKLAYIQYNYAKSISQLCNSRHGKLQKIFNDKTTEYFKPLQKVWGSVLEDMLTYSESHLTVAYTLQREIKPSLSNFSNEELAKQIEVANHGKKVIGGLKDDLVKLSGERKKVYKAILSENSEEMKEMADDVQDNRSNTKLLQRKWIRSKDSHAHAYSVTMPSILEELNNTSVRRVETVCNNIGHFASLMKSTRTTFSNTSSSLLSAQDSLLSIRHVMTNPTPQPPPELRLDLSRSEMETLCQTPAKKFLNNIQEKVFPGGFVRSNSTEQAALDNSPFRDISHKVANMWSTIRTRTISGNLVESANDDTLLDPEDDSILDVEDAAVVQGKCAVEEEAGDRDKIEISPNLNLQDPEKTREEDMIISLSSSPDGTEDYVVVDE